MLLVRVRSVLRLRRVVITETSGGVGMIVAARNRGVTEDVCLVLGTLISQVLEKKLTKNGGAVDVETLLQYHLLRDPALRQLAWARSSPPSPSPSLSTLSWSAKEPSLDRPTPPPPTHTSISYVMALLEERFAYRPKLETMNGNPSSRTGFQAGGDTVSVDLAF